jgi:hypothetical protein
MHATIVGTLLSSQQGKNGGRTDEIDATPSIS